MFAPQNIHESTQNFQNEDEIDQECFLLSPKAPNLRPAESPEVEFEDFMLPEPLLGDEAFEVEDCAAELEDFFLDDAPSQQTIAEKDQSQREQASSRGRAFERVEKNSSFQNRFSNGFENHQLTSRKAADYQMSQISGDLNCSAEGAVELILRKKSISI